MVPAGTLYSAVHIAFMYKSEEQLPRLCVRAYGIRQLAMPQVATRRRVMMPTHPRRPETTKPQTVVVMPCRTVIPRVIPYQNNTLYNSHIQIWQKRQSMSTSSNAKLAKHLKSFRHNPWRTFPWKPFSGRINRDHGYSGNGGRGWCAIQRKMV